MRVIAGEAKGRRLKMVPGSSTRPVGERVKEALFGILGDMVVDARFLDLYAGTGSVGIEALSRGAQSAVFVDRGRQAIATIKDNLTHTRLGDKTLRAVDQSGLLSPGGLVVAQIHPKEYEELELENLQLTDQRKYGSTILCFYA
jgi:16S rRNA G966 N2-methylase RsmD